MLGENIQSLEKFIATKDITVLEAMQKIDKNAKNILYIIEDDGTLFGSLTDGDIRRWILKSGDLNAPVINATFTKTRSLHKNEIDKSTS